MKKYRTQNIFLSLIILFFLSIKIFHLLNQKGISWDSAVYINMGKYIFTLGKAGLWEPARPLIWPILLGMSWKISLNPIIFGRILGLILSVSCIYLTYQIGKNIFNENIALLSASLLAFSPTFLFYSSTLLTGIPSTFFSLLSVYFLIKKNHFSAGLFLALSFMTRFLQLIILIPFIIYLITQKRNRLKNVLSLIYGFSIVVLPYLTLNIFLYKNPLYPFILQSFMTKYSGWIYHQPLTFYFINLFKENFLVLFAVAGAIVVLKQKNHKKTTILSIFLLLFFLFSLIKHKEMRFILVFLPYIYLIVSYGIFKSLNLIKKEKRLFYSAIALIGIIWLGQVTPQIKIPFFKEYPNFRSYIETNNIKDGLWISNPIFTLNSNKKPDELIYYPLYNSKKIDSLKDRLPKANHILIDTCDILPCPPEDRDCTNKTNHFLNYLKNNFKTIHHKKENNCEQFIFEKIIP